MMPSMQNTPFNLASCLEFAAKYHGEQQIVTRLVENDQMVTHTYRQVLARTKKLANALKKLDLKFGDRVATIALNTHRHLEAWYAISGQGLVCHTVNPRLSMPQLAYIVNHAEDAYIMIDPIFWPIVEGMHSKFPKVKGYIVLTEQAFMPDTKVPNVYCYEDLLAQESDDFEWPEFDEHSPSSLCYTSGTTGNPKGVMYTHRSNLNHSYAISSPDATNMRSTDTILVVVPLFHANSWGIAYAGPFMGVSMLMPGKRMDGAALFEMIETHNANKAAGVPTIWNELLTYCEKEGKTMSSLQELVVGGAAAPPYMFEAFEKNHGADLLHAWGMTEMSPLGTINRPTKELESLSAEDQHKIRLKQGRPVFGVDMKIVDEGGRELPRDGKAIGHLFVKGNWVVHSYYLAEEPAVDAQGWFDTGDMATIDPFGYMEIVDRAKDLIKSGGEWISSVDMENHVMSHPEVSMAAVIGIPDEKWGERPMLVVVSKEGMNPSEDSIKNFVGQVFADWQVPDRIEFVDQIPLSATGKFSKITLREQFTNS